MSLLTSVLILAACTHGAAVVALYLAGRYRATLDLPLTAALVSAGVILGDVVDDAAYGRPVTFGWCSPLLAAVVLGYAWRKRRELRWSGASTWSSLLVFGAASGLWGVGWLAQLELSRPTTVLLWALVPVTMVTLPSAILTQREGLEPLIRHRWRHQHTPLAPRTDGSTPFVSIQVPCHAEPPDVVIATLDRLAGLHYPEFEVLVIDNNTTDPRLWMPVRDHCEHLGSRFRFLHVEGITGAKAGALNWARPHIDPRAELIGVVDADYHVHRDWLSRTVGFFDDPRTGFVQPPHAYRDWHHSRFTRMANWEYSVFFQTGMVSLQEHGAGITVGTMSVIRLEALDTAGGWAEWCQTEDSELAVRIHDAGYASIYLTEPLGWGLIPDTFAGYRHQRHRWTYGPVQELRRHWRRFLPVRCGGSTTLRWHQKLHHLNHGADVACIAIRFLTWPIALAAAFSLVANHEQIPVPFELWLASTFMLATSLAIRWLQFRLTGATLAEALGAAFAYQALTLTISLAALTALTGKPVAWRRTNKFRAERRGLAALHAARAETVMAGAFAGIALALVAVGTTGMTTMLAIGFAARAAVFASAPLLAVIADRDLAHTTPDTTPTTPHERSSPGQPAYAATADSTV